MGSIELSSSDFLAIYRYGAPIFALSLSQTGGTFASRGYKGDGESPSEIGMQVQISNHLKLLWSKARVVSIEEKAYEIRQVRSRS